VEDDELVSSVVVHWAEEELAVLMAKGRANSGMAMS
jgi:hypothetical protein